MATLEEKRNVLVDYLTQENSFSGGKKLAKIWEKGDYKRLYLIVEFTSGNLWENGEIVKDKDGNSIIPVAGIPATYKNLLIPKYVRRELGSDISNIFLNLKTWRVGVNKNAIFHDREAALAIFKKIVSLDSYEIEYQEFNKGGLKSRASIKKKEA